MSDTAVLIIDVQNDYCHPDGVFAKVAKFPIDTIPAIYQNINRLVLESREKSIPVIWVKMMWDNDEEVGILGDKSTFLKHEGLRRGTWGSELVDKLDVHPDDMIVEKKRFSAFYKTELAEVLKELGVQKLIIGGVRTDFCVESTVRDAFFRDYEVITASDCVASYIQKLHEGSLQVMGTVFSKVMKTDEIIDTL
jgi:ureidoacrylate peracid hydrolase